jgi:hypothetical protein
VVLLVSGVFGLYSILGWGSYLGEAEAVVVFEMHLWLRGVAGLSPLLFPSLL